MPDQDLFTAYAEAVAALGAVDDLKRQALRKAVEQAATRSDEARTAMAGQQRMFDRAGRDADDAGRLLDELRALLRAPAAASGAGGAPVGIPPTMVEIRGSISEVTRWAVETKPLVESLLRTRTRLARTPPPPPAAKPETHGPWWLLLIAVPVLLAIIVAFVAAR